jgi:hypothetical protein
MPSEHFFQSRTIIRRDIGEHDALMSSQADVGTILFADFTQRGLELKAVDVVDAAILDVQTVVPAAVPLLAPAHVVVEALDVFRMRIGQLLAVVFLDLALELFDAPVGDQVL